jgi:GPH family glycoside/pentoside/hexuronide:cation symporter
MLVFTSLAVIGASTIEEEVDPNQISAKWEGVTIVAVVAVIFCVLGAVILLFYNEKKVMATIKDHEQKAALEGISFDDNEEPLEEVAQEEASDSEEATEVEEKEE